MLAAYIVAGVVGVMLFFSVAVAPAIFKVLPAEWAAVYVRQFFPKYYAVLGSACLLALWLSPEPRFGRLALIAALLFATALFALTPAINRASDQRRRRLFGVLHGTSIVINLAQLGLLIYALWLLRAAPV